MSSRRRPVNTFRSSTFIGVTSALSCIDEVTYVIGVGGDVIIARIDQQVCRVEAKAHLSAIHRVRTLHTRRLADEDETIVFAAAHRTLSVYRLSRLLILQRISIVNADQRIIAVQSHVKDASVLDVLVGTAHNSVECWRLTHRPLVTVTRRYIVRGERCILYTMSVHQTTVFAGTVYGDIIMWSAEESQVLPEVRDVQQRLSGHRGVVFSIDVSYDMALIASASDDRTVILWKRQCNGIYVQQLICYGHTSRVWQCRIINQQTDVVSCGEDGTVRCWNVQSGDCTGLLTCRAGIRNIVIRYNCRSAILAVDDGSIQLWDCQQSSAQMTAISVTTSEKQNADEIPDKTQQQLFTEPCRHLKICDDDTLILASTLHTLQRLTPLSLSDKSYQCHRLVLPEQIGNIPDAVTTALSLSPSADRIAVGCKNGALYIASLLDNTEYAYVTAHRAAVTFILWITTSDTPMLLLSADALGHVKNWRFDTSAALMTLVLLSSFRLANQAPVTAALALQSQDKYILLLGDMRGSLYVYTVHSLSHDHSVVVAQTRLIDVHETCALTCFLLTSQSNENVMTFISAGRNDTINHYTLKQTTEHMLTQDSNPSSNGHDTQNDDDTWQSHHNGLISAEDMTRVDKQSSHAYMIQEDRAYRVRGLTSAERIWLDNNTGTIFVCGFRSDTFVLVDVTNETVIATVDCGGGRRPWDYYHRNHVFLFSRRSKSDDNEVVSCQLPIHTSSSVTINKDMMMSMTKSFHSRLCTSLVVVNHYSSTFVITGSEDMTIKLYRLNTPALICDDDDSNCIHDSLSLINTLTDHPDAVRCLSLVEHQNINGLNNKSSMFTLYSAGSCHYLHAYQLNIITNNENENDAKLSIHSYGGIGGKVWKLTGKVWLRQAETEAMRMTKMDIRITALTAFTVDTQTDCVVTGDSTGQMIIYLFAFSTSRFYPVHLVTAAHNRVVMALTNISMTTTNEHFVISGGSDGVMSLWNVTTILRTAMASLVQSRLAAAEVSAPEKRVKQRAIGLQENQSALSVDAQQYPTTDNGLSPIISISAHQCGCNAIAAYVTDDGRIIIATGGDDQLLRVSAVTVSNDSQTNYTTNVVVNAHTSSITSLVLTDHQTLLSSGYDQRLRRWHVKDDLDVLLISVDRFELNVSDITSIATARTVEKTSNERSAGLRRVFVGGDGMQILVINDTST